MRHFVNVDRKGKQFHIFKYHLVPIALYGILTAIVTWPLLLHLRTHIPAGNDTPWFLWDLWWFKHAIFDLLRSPLTTDLIFYPSNQVTVSWQTPISELFAQPLQMAGGVIFLFNTLTIASFFMAGYFMYLLTLLLVKRPDLAFVGGVIFTFSPYHVIHSLGHLSLASVQWMPLALLLLIQAWRKPTWQRGVAAGIGISLVMLTTPYYAAYFLLPLSICAALYVGFRYQHHLYAKLRDTGFGKTGLIAFLVAATIAAPFYLSYLLAPAEYKQAAMAASKAAYVYQADLLSILLPPANNPVWKSLLSNIYWKFTPGYLAATTNFFGFATLILTISAFFLRKRLPKQVSFWLSLAGLTWMLSLGPTLRIWRFQALDWMPYRLFMALPGAYAFRIPGRLGITTILAATIAAMFVVAWWMKRKPHWPWRLIIIVWIILILIDFSVQFPYPIVEASVPREYNPIAQTPEEFALLELPAGELFLKEISWDMYYQTFHHKPIVSGYLGRRPRELIETTDAMPFVHRFFVTDYGAFFSERWEDLVDWPDLGDATMPVWPDDVRNASQILYDQGIRYTLLHKDLPYTGFIRRASLLLNHALGLPLKSTAEIVQFESKPMSVISRNAPDGVFEIIPKLEAPSKSFPHQDFQAYPISAPVTSQFDIPFSGVWKIQGVLEGERVSQIKFLLEDNPIAPQKALLFDNTYTFAYTDYFSVGTYTFTLLPPELERNGSSPLLFDLHARIQRLDTHVSEAAQARFVNEAGKQIDLLGAGILTIGDDDLLFTIWQLPDAETFFQSKPGLDLFVHILSSENVQIEQADHEFGVHSLLVRKDDKKKFSVVIDFIPLPEIDNPDATIRIGLWRPKDQAYFWVTDSRLTDEQGRLSLGTIETLKNR